MQTRLVIADWTNAATLIPITCGEEQGETTPNKFAHCAYEPAARRSAAFRLQTRAPRDWRLSSLKAAFRQVVHAQMEGTVKRLERGQCVSAASGVLRRGKELGFGWAGSSRSLPSSLATVLIIFLAVLQGEWMILRS